MRHVQTKFGYVWATLLMVVAPLRVDAVDVAFAFTFDSSFTSNAGAQLAPSESDFIYVGNYISSMLKSGFGGSSVVHITVSGLNNTASNILASASGYTFTNTDFNKDLAQLAVQDGYVNTGGYPEGVATMNFGWNWGYGGTVGSSQLDFRYVILHELFHAIGFQSYIGANGQSVFSNPLAYSYFDQYLQGWDGSQYVNLVQRDGSNTPTGAMSGAAAALTNNAHPVLFNGPNVVAYLGHAAEMYTPTTWSSGSSISHYNYPGMLEYYAIAGYGPLNFGFSGLDIAFLKDLGYTVVPEPGTYILTALSVVVLVVARRRGVGQAKSA